MLATSAIAAAQDRRPWTFPFGIDELPREIQHLHSVHFTISPNIFNRISTSLNRRIIVIDDTARQHRVTGQVRAFRRTFGKAAPTADSASGKFFVRHIPPLPNACRLATALPQNIKVYLMSEIIFTPQYTANDVSAFCNDSIAIFWYGK